LKRQDRKQQRHDSGGADDGQRPAGARQFHAAGRFLAGPALLLFGQALPLDPGVAAQTRHPCQHVVRQLEMRQAQPLFRSQHPPIDQRIHVGLEPLLHRGVSRHRGAEAVGCQQPVLDELARPRIETGECLLVEVAQDVRRRVVDEIGGDLRQAFPQAPRIQLPAHEAQECRINGELFEWDRCVGRGDLPDNLLRNALRDEPDGRQQHRPERLPAVETRERETVVHHRRHPLAHEIEPRHEVFAQRDHHLVVLLRCARGQRLARPLEAVAHAGRNVVLDEIRKLRQQLAPSGMPLSEREDLLELIDHDHRGHRVVASVPEHRPVQELPEGLVRLPGLFPRFLLDPVACEGLRECRPDLADQARVRVRVVESHGHGEEVLAREPWKEAGLQQGCFSRARRPEYDRQHFSSEQAEQLLGLGLPAVEESGIVFGIRLEARPWLVGMRHAWRRGGRCHVLSPPAASRAARGCVSSRPR
jgi:hypothetical protein